MRALTVCQPYAEMIAQGGDLKPIENRTWETSYRGPLLIHAGKSRDWLEPGDETDYPRMVFGAFVAVGDLVACLFRDGPLPWPKRYAHLYDHEHANGPVCWILDQVWRLPEPIPCAGKQGLWIPTTEMVRAVTHAVMSHKESA